MMWVMPRAPVLTKYQSVELAEIFHLLGDVNRLRLSLLCLDGPLSVGDLATKLRLSQSLVSHHLRLLRGARVLRPERDGKRVFYQLADRHISRMLRDMATHIREPNGADEK